MKDVTKQRKRINIESRRRYGISFSFKKLLEDEQNAFKEKHINNYASIIESPFKGKKSTKSLGKSLILNNLLLETEKQELIKLYGDDDKVK